MKNIVIVGYEFQPSHIPFFEQVAKCSDAQLEVLTAPNKPNQTYRWQDRIPQIFQNTEMVVVDAPSYGNYDRPTTEKSLLYRISQDYPIIKESKEKVKQCLSGMFSIEQTIQRARRNQEQSLEPVNPHELNWWDLDMAIDGLRSKGLPEIVVPYEFDKLRRAKPEIWPVILYLASHSIGIQLTQSLLRIGYDWILGNQIGFDGEISKTGFGAETWKKIPEQIRQLQEKEEKKKI